MVPIYRRKLIQWIHNIYQKQYLDKYDFNKYINIYDDIEYINKVTTIDELKKELFLKYIYVYCDDDTNNMNESIVGGKPKTRNYRKRTKKRNKIKCRKKGTIKKTLKKRHYKKRHYKKSTENKIKD